MNSIYPGSVQLPLMKYNGKPTQTIIDEAFFKGTYVAQEKKDGALYMLEKVDEETIYLFARTKSRKTGELVEKIDNVPHIKRWAKCLPDQTTLLGEIYIPGGHSNNVTQIMGCTPANAQNRQYTNDSYGGPIHYYIFDCLRWNGVDCQTEGFIHRFKHIQDFFLSTQNEKNKYVELATIYTSDFETVLSQIFTNGGEGLVFKKKDAIYEPGKRPTKTYFKMKEHIDSIDLVCIGLEEPVRQYTGDEVESWTYWIKRGEQMSNGSYNWYPIEGNYFQDWIKNSYDYEPVTKHWFFGWKNAMTLGLYKNDQLISVGRVASGLTDDIRKDMAENPENYLNQVVEVSCMSLNKKDYTLRHPVFEKMRYDKNIEDCTISSVFE